MATSAILARFRTELRPHWTPSFNIAISDACILTWLQSRRPDYLITQERIIADNNLM